MEIHMRVMSNKVTPGSPQATSVSISNRYPLSVEFVPRAMIFAGYMIRPGWKGIGDSGLYLPYPHLLQPFHASLCGREVGSRGYRLLNRPRNGPADACIASCDEYKVSHRLALLHKANVVIFYFQPMTYHMTFDLASARIDVRPLKNSEEVRATNVWPRTDSG